jgi:hypothetical protein
MKITETTLSLGKTVNLGNYESLRADLSIKVNLEDGETFEDTVSEMKTVLAKNLEMILNNDVSPKEDFI